MKKFSGLLLSALALTLFSEAQTSRYIIRFKDKGDNPYSISNPAPYLSQRAIDRRTRYAINIDSTDLPVTPRYIDSLRAAGAVTILNISKWLNAVSIQTSDAAAISRINSFPFVQSVTGIAPKMMNPAGRAKLPSGIQASGEPQELTSLPFKTLNTTADYFDYGASYNQVHIHNGEFLHNIGLRGQTMVIGMLDAGFNNYLNLTAFDSIRANGQILGVYDFVAKDSSVNEDHSHGTQCFSTIGANIPGQFVGTAPKASFYLFRSEDVSTEYPIEEFNWVCAAERVDSVGGDMISSSVGYNTFDPPMAAFSHTYAEMNGNTTTPAIGADLAAKKGILVVNSAGNEGNNSWKYLITPADGDSVLAVGAVSATGAVASFSSYGPSSDGQVKPDVASVGLGTIVQYANNFIGANNGTSFSAPNMAGLAACLWQGFREYNNMKIIQALRQAGSIATTPNDRIGYGIPDVKLATMNLLKEFASATASANNCRVTLNWASKDMQAMKYEIERLLPGQTAFQKIAEQQGTGAIFSNHNYQLIDDLTDQPSGLITYRVRQIIDTASASFMADYIDTVTVTSHISCVSSNAITLIPNPTRSKLTLKVGTLQDADQLVIRIFNSKGQLVYEQRTSKPTGIAFYDISVDRFAAGKYYVSVYNGNSLIDTKELLKL